MDIGYPQSFGGFLVMHADMCQGGGAKDAMTASGTVMEVAASVEPKDPATHSSDDQPPESTPMSRSAAAERLLGLVAQVNLADACLVIGIRFFSPETILLTAIGCRRGQYLRLRSRRWRGRLRQCCTILGRIFVLRSLSRSEPSSLPFRSTHGRLGPWQLMLIAGATSLYSRC